MTGEPRALADALEVQERRDGVNVAELHRLAVEASRTDSTSSAVRHATEAEITVALYGLTVTEIMTGGKQ